MATAELRELGGCCGGARTGEGGGGNAKTELWLSAGGCWRDNAALRRVVAGAVRALATRSHGDLHAARGV